MIRRGILALAFAVGLAQWSATAAAQPHNVEAETHPAAASTDHAAGGHDAGHKTYDLLADPSDAQTWYAALWVLIIFIVLLAILYPTAWKNVLAGLKAREERIRKDIADAEAARTRADATLREYNTQLAAAEGRVRDMLAKATADGEGIAASIRARAQQDAEDTRERAMRDIDAARDQAVAELHSQAAVLATSVAEKILRRNLSPDDQRDLVDTSLAEISAVGAGGKGAGGRRGAGAGAGTGTVAGAGAGSGGRRTGGRA
jgi:F-type H+-transporting ATPase subunit b